MNTEAINDRAYPNSPGFKGRAETGRQAANRVAGHAELQRKQIMEHFKYDEMTHDECAAAMRPTSMNDVEFETFKRGIRSRCSELKEQGKLEATELRRKNASGHPAVVWRKATAKPATVVAVVTTAPATTASTRATQQELL